MKLIPDALGRKLGEQGLLASEKAPKVLFVGGVVGMVGSTVLACRATLQLEEKLDKIEHDISQIKRAKAFVDESGGQTQSGETFTDEEVNQSLNAARIKGAASIVKLYIPAVVVGGISICALTKSHNILRDRNLALTAAYAAVEGAYQRYRERVIDRYGEDVDREFRYGAEEVDEVDEETGEVLNKVRACDLGGSPYARWYDSESSRNWSVDPRVNMMFLRTQQNWLNDRLRIRGHVYLNEVFTSLGLAHTVAGAVVGWRWNKGSGDDYIDFGCWGDDREEVAEFFNGREGAILLDFNVDGTMYNLIDEPGR